MKTNYKYDVAISFAEEDRNAALALSLALELKGVEKVYYYPNNYVEIWGQDIEKRLDAIYSTEAKYAITLISNYYFKKPFAQLELAAIRSRSIKNNDKVYLMPVILPNIKKRVLKENPDLIKLGRISWNYNPKEIAAALVELLGRERKELNDYKPPGGVQMISSEGNIIQTRYFHYGDVHNVTNKVDNKTIIQNNVDNLHIGTKINNKS